VNGGWPPLAWMQPIVAAWPYELRRWTGADLPWLFDAAQDAEVQRWTSVPSPYTLADALGFLGRADDHWVHGTHLHLAITSADTGLLLGNIVLKDIDWSYRRAEVGYWLARDARGNGVASTAVVGLTAWAFGELGLDTIELRAAVGNLASQAVARRSGYLHMGMEPGGCFDGDTRSDNALFVIRRDGVRP